jgi:hypothetical protein
MLTAIPSSGDILFRHIGCNRIEETVIFGGRDRAHTVAHPMGENAPLYNDKGSPGKRTHRGELRQPFRSMVEEGPI